jgi:hypothetical protein
MRRLELGNKPDASLLGVGTKKMENMFEMLRKKVWIGGDIEMYSILSYFRSFTNDVFLLTVGSSTT